MAYRISYKLSKQEWEALVHFSNLIGVDVNKIAKQSLFMSIQEAYRRASLLEKGSDSDDNTGGAPGDHLEADISQKNSSDVLAEEGSTGADKAGE
jgi:hypothetical protein